MLDLIILIFVGAFLLYLLSMAALVMGVIVVGITKILGLRSRS